jgi:hypothetical protein
VALGGSARAGSSHGRHRALPSRATQNRYPFLALLSVVLRIAALLTAIFGTLAGVVVIALAVRGGVAGFATLSGVRLGIGIIVGSLLSALGTAATADLYDLLIPIERNVRRRLRHPDERDEPEQLNW